MHHVCTVPRTVQAFDKRHSNFLRKGNRVGGMSFVWEEAGCCLPVRRLWRGMCNTVRRSIGLAEPGYDMPAQVWVPGGLAVAISQAMLLGLHGKHAVGCAIITAAISTTREFSTAERDCLLRVLPSVLQLESQGYYRRVYHHEGVVHHEDFSPPVGLSAQAQDGPEDGRRLERLGDPDGSRGERECVMVAPEVVPASIQHNSPGNLHEGLQKRVIEKQKKCQPTPDLRRRVETAVDYIKQVVLCPKKVKEWRNLHVHHDLKSGKWTEQRFDNAVAQANKTTRVPMAEGQVKQEVVVDAGKPCRPIVSRGDVAQVAQLDTMACLEHLLFDHFAGNIKHRSKTEAMEHVRGLMNSVKSTWFAEGDGSAWDATITTDLKNVIENPVIEHIREHLGLPVHIPGDLVADDGRNRRSRKLKIKHRNATKPEVIPSIRESGDRGTSVLNFLVNYVIWCSVLSENPWSMMASKKKFKDINGKSWRYALACEGDDSLVCSGFFSVPENVQRIEEEWSSLGFNMKINVRSKGIVEFCGYSFLVDGGLTDTYGPGVKRTLARSAWSFRPEESRATLFSRACQYAGSFQPLANYYAACARAHSPGVVSRDVAMLMNDEKITLDQLESNFNDSSSAFDYDRWKPWLEAQGINATLEDCCTLLSLQTVDAESTAECGILRKWVA